MDKIQEEIIEEFSVFDDWLDKYDYLIGLADTLPAIDPTHRTEQYLIQGCQSRVWVDARMDNGKVYYAADSDAIDHQRHHRLADTGAQRPHAARNPRYGTLFHRRYRTERQPFAHAVKRIGGDGEANAALCAGIRQQGGMNGSPYEKRKTT